MSEASRQMFRPQYGCVSVSACSSPPKLPHVLLIGGTCATYGLGSSRCRYTIPVSDASEPVSSLAPASNCWVVLAFFLQSFGGQRWVNASTTLSRYDPPRKVKRLSR